MTSRPGGVRIAPGCVMTQEDLDRQTCSSDYSRLLPIMESGRMLIDDCNA